MPMTVGIIFFGDFFQDARCINIVESIIKSGNNVWVIDASNSSAKNYKRAKLYHLNIDLNKKGIRKFFQFFTLAKTVIKRQSSDVLIAGDLYSVPSIVQGSKNQKLIYDSREIYSHLGGLSKKPLTQFFWSTVEKIYISKINNVIVTAPSDRKYLQQRYRLESIETIYNFPTPKINPHQPKNNLRTQFGIEEGKKILLYQGKLFDGRGLFQIIDIVKQDNNFVAVFVGDGNLKPKIIKYAQKNGVESRVFFTGAVPYYTMFEFTQQADVGCSLIEPISKSYEHALPNKIFEYALCGVPTIASDLPEMKSIIETYKIGKTVPNHDTKTQIESIYTILKPNRKNEISKTAHQHFTWESQHNTVVELLGLNEIS